MSRLLPVLFSLLVSFSALAQSAAPAEVASEPPNMVGAVVFVVLFIGSCIGFVGYVWWRGRKKEPGEGA